MYLPSGKIIIANKMTKEWKYVLPLDCNLSSVLLMNHVLDRASTGLSMMNFSQFIGLLWTWSWGFFHDTWNAVKTACKTANGGRWWKTIVTCLSIANLNFGPFRSGAWGKAKHSAHAAWMSSHTVDSPDFIEAADKTALLLPQHAAENYAFWWHFVGNLASCIEGGILLKFARWLSIEEAWEYYRPQMWFLKEILQLLSPQSAMHHLQSSTTAMLDAEVAEKLTEGKTGLMARAHTYI